MRATRMHGYGRPLVHGEVPVPEINEKIEMLRTGEVVARAVIKY